jgi:hypothetical protein
MQSPRWPAADAVVKSTPNDAVVVGEFRTGCWPSTGAAPLEVPRYDVEHSARGPPLVDGS